MLTFEELVKREIYKTCVLYNTLGFKYWAFENQTFLLLNTEQVWYSNGPDHLNLKYEGIKRNSIFLSHLNTSPDFNGIQNPYHLPSGPLAIIRNPDTSGIRIQKEIICGDFDFTFMILIRNITVSWLPINYSQWISQPEKLILFFVLVVNKTGFSPVARIVERWLCIYETDG